jgi:hypothetical protein
VSAPPLRLPGEHFIAALVFLFAGAVGLISIAPALATASYPMPAVVGITHLFTLGWLTTSIMGALYQFLPVALGQSIASERVAHLTFVLHVSGVSALVAGMYLARSALLLTGVTVLSVAIVTFLVNLGITLHRAERRELTWWAVCAASIFLAVTLVFGAALSWNLRTGFLGKVREIAVRTHVHVALFGWVLIVIVGVSYRLLPMFLLSHGGRTDFARYAVSLLAAGAGMLTMFHHVLLLGREVPALLLGAGVVAFLMQAREFFRKRHRPALDPGLCLAAMSLGLLAVVIPLGALEIAGITSLHVRVAYVLTALLACTLFVAAHYYKIVPFLVWNRHFGPLAGTRTLPRVGDLYSQRIARVAVSALALGGTVLTVSVIAGSFWSIRVGAALFATGVVIEASQMTAIARRRP